MRENKKLLLFLLVMLVIIQAATHKSQEVTTIHDIS
jgi:hypothetical protein